MNSIKLLILDLKETRRRFLMVAKCFPNDLISWKPDLNALSVGEMIRHVLLHDYSWMFILKENRIPTDEELADLENAPYITIEKEIENYGIYQKEFLEYISTLNTEELETRIISWPHRPIKRTLGDTLERKSYHDAVHTGQLLQYLRMLQIDRPDIWD